MPKEKLRVGKHTVFPDGTLREVLFETRRGYWEAKDTDDDLDEEISKKIAKGYPLNNTIFEDTRQAVLFQGGRERDRFDIADPKQLSALLNEFYAWTDPEIENFQQAVEEFKTRVPELAARLVVILNEAHQKNKKFQAAFDGFFAVCQQTLNPNISRAAVDEMLVQHLLTERLIRKIFDNPEFTRRNVIAIEVEKVIDALVSLSFNRDDFLRSLDRFYRAIEDAAHTLEDFSEKQHFLNTVYERFFQGYSVKVADTHGIVYTPQEIVDFMCASVEKALRSEFGLTLGSPNVNLLDPCTGTGNFIVNLINRIPKKDLPRTYREHLFANEVMLLPYYIAALNIEHAYYDRTGRYESFDGLCFVDTLELAEDKGALDFMTRENTQRVEREKAANITVVIGNPPYNVGQINENDNNKNRKYPVIDSQIKALYIQGSTGTLHTKLHDPYVKFFRWATDRLEDRDGIVCFVSNNSFIEQGAFDAMRKQLLADFTRILHIDLHGNVRENPTQSGTTHNVFGIQVGVGITMAIRRRAVRSREIRYHRVPEDWRKQQKLGWLSQVGDFSGIALETVTPDENNTWLIPANAEQFSSFIPVGSKETKAEAGQDAFAIFKTYSLGASTNRDSFVYSFDPQILAQRVDRFCDDYNAEVERFARKGGGLDIDSFLDYSKVKWSETLKSHLKRGDFAKFDRSFIRQSTYRPFCKQYLYYDPFLVDRPGLFGHIFPTEGAERENTVICVPTVGNRAAWTVFASGHITNLNLISVDAVQCFPTYVYAEDGTERRDNVTDWSLKQFRSHFGQKRITKRDIFYYVYGVLHHPGYRTKFADNLKRELPRIPFAPDFWAFAKAGQELARLHLDYEKLEPYPLKWIETEGVPLSYRVEDKMRLSKDKTALRVNPSLTLADIPPETLQYRLGNRSALEWVVDQYQVSEDKRSGIRSDPNRPDDEEYIVRLVGQVVRVSVETVRIVAGLPDEYTV